MPLYEYHCLDCDAEFEAIVSFRDADNVACERCGSARVERVASAFACSVGGSGGSVGGSGGSGAGGGGDALPCGGG